MNFGGAKWCVLSEKMSFETFTPIWSHVNKSEKHSEKNPKFEMAQFFEYLW